MNRLTFKSARLFVTAVLILCVLCGCSVGDLSFVYKDTGNTSAAEKYSALNDSEKTNYIEKQITNALSSGKNTVEFDFDATDKLKTAYNRVILSHPEFFWLSGSSLYKKQESKNGSVKVTFTAEPYLTDAEKKQYESKLDDVCDPLLEKINSLKSDYEKAVFIHDYIVDNTTYDKENADAVINAGKGENPDKKLLVSASLYGCFVDKKAICTGYAAAFMYLARKSGLEAVRINGESRESGVGHQWNCVKIENEWYYADVTWDDSDNEDNGAFGRSYEFFLITSDELALTHITDDDMSPPECSAVKFNYYVKNGLFLPKYTREAFSRMFDFKLHNNVLSVKFGSKEECDKAFADLFEKEKYIWQIPSVKANKPDSIDTFVSSNGMILSIKI